LARLIEAYECSPERAEHVLQWEGLPGRVSDSSNPVGPQDEAGISKPEEEARGFQYGSLLHRGQEAEWEFSRLLESWHRSHFAVDASEFEVNTFLDNSELPLWRFSGETITPKESDRIFGWSVENIEKLRLGDAEQVERYKSELEESSYLSGLSVREREERVAGELADLSAAADSMHLNRRFASFRDGFEKWTIIETSRTGCDQMGLSSIWLRMLKDNPGLESSPPQRAAEFPNNLPPEIRRAYEDLREAMSKLPLTSNLTEKEYALQRLINMSRQMEDSVGIRVWIEEWNELREETGRPTLPEDCRWYDFSCALMELEAKEAVQGINLRRSRAKLHIQWAKELVGMLPVLAERNAELSVHPIAALGEAIPKSVAALFEKAHLSYLFDLEIPCVITCGALIEESIRIACSKVAGLPFCQTSDDEESGQYRMIEFLKARNPQCYPALALADNIRAIRNIAVHDPAKYLALDRSLSTIILNRTREVMRILFESKASDEGTE
jgi:hypothetical protein